MKKRGFAKALVPSVVTIAILFCVCACKQIFPFGQNTVDYYDMGQLEGAFYYHTWDFMHGEKSPFYDWYSGLGVNMTATSTVYNIFSIFNPFFLFMKRTAVFESLSILTILRLSLCAFTMYLFLKEESGADYGNQVLFSVLYALSGYCLQYYVLSSFLEIAVFFPLLFLFFLRMMRGRSFLPYTLLLTLCMMTCYYLGAMILMFLLMAAGMYLLLIEEKEKRKQTITRLGFATVIALLLSSCLLVPQLVQTFSSSRFTNDAGGISQYLKILKNEFGSYTIRWWHLLNMTPAIAVTAWGCFYRIRKKEGRREMAFLLGLIGLVGISLLSESVNLMLHFGSYIQFPLRNGFLLCFSLCLSGAVFSGDFTWKKAEMSVRSALSALLPTVVCAVAAAGLLYAYFRSDVWEFKQIFRISALFCAVLFAAYSFLLHLGKRAAVRFSFLLLSTVELFMVSMVLFGKPHYRTGYSEEPEQDGSYVEKTMQLMEELPIAEGELDRIKNPDTTLNANYPFVMKRAALSNWTHLIGRNLQTGVNKLGYAVQFTRLLDGGGTVFSDALLHVTQVVSLEEQEEELYCLQSEASGYGLYDCKYTLPFGIAVSEEVKDISPRKQNFVSLQNEFYRLLTGEGDLIAPVELPEGWEKTEGRRIVLPVFVQGRGVLYFKGNNGTEMEDYMRLSVNGREVSVPTVSQPVHREYPAHFNNACINLGVYENEEVTVEIELLQDVQAKQLKIRMGVLDLDKMEVLCERRKENDTKALASGRHLSLTAQGSRERNMLLLPVAYDEGLRVRVNGERQEAYEVIGAFTAVPLAEGENKIEITFVPMGTEAGILLTVIGFLLLLTVVFAERKGLTEALGIIQIAAQGCYWFCFFGILLLVYLIPAAANLAGFLLKIAM